MVARTCWRVDAVDELRALRDGEFEPMLDEARAYLTVRGKLLAEGGKPRR